jgi:hypothetical protein
MVRVFSILAGEDALVPEGSKGRMGLKATHRPSGAPFFKLWRDSNLMRDGAECGDANSVPETS